MLLGEGDEVPVEIERGGVGGRVRRVAGDERDRLGHRMDHRPLQRREEGRRRLGRHGADHAARHQEAEGVDRVARIGHQHDIARPGDGLRHVGEALLGPQRCDDLGVGVELHAEAALVIMRLGPTQAPDALGGRIAVGARLASGLDQLLDDMLGRRQVRIAHAEIDDVDALGALGGLDLVDLFEDVGRQALDAVKIGHSNGSFAGGPASLSPGGRAAAPQTVPGPPLAIQIVARSAPPAASLVTGGRKTQDSIGSCRETGAGAGRAGALSWSAASRAWGRAWSPASSPRCRRPRWRYVSLRARPRSS